MNVCLFKDLVLYSSYKVLQAPSIGLTNDQNLVIFRRQLLRISFRMKHLTYSETQTFFQLLRL